MFKSRGRLKQIDDALAAWHGVALGTDVPLKLAAAYSLVKECRRWTFIKQAEMTDGKGKESTGQRMEQVFILFQQAVECMDELVRLLGVDRAFNRFEGRKHTLGPHHVVQPLQGVYKHERTLYVEYGKKRAPSGTLLHGRFDDHRHKLNSPRFEGLTLNGYRKLDSLVKRQLDVLYFNKIQRLKYMAFPVSGLLCDSQDQPLSTVSNRGEPYAMDRYGNLFVDVDSYSETRQFNHSTFNSGRDVICAGCLWITNGLLTRIDNSSGHYKPTQEHLSQALQVLAAEGVNLEATVAAVVVPPSPGIPEWRLHEFKALDLANDPNSPDYVVL